MEDMDLQIGRNLTRMRGERSQKDVASAMRDRGWKWSQATVWSVEKGERPLRLAEAQDLGPLLGYFAHDLTRSDSGVKLREALKRVTDRNRELEVAIREYGQALWMLAWTADEAEEMTQLDADAVPDWLERTPDVVVREVVARGVFDDGSSGWDEDDDDDVELNEKLKAQARAAEGQYTRKLRALSDGEGPTSYPAITSDDSDG